MTTRKSPEYKSSFNSELLNNFVADLNKVLAPTAVNNLKTETDEIALYFLRWEHIIYDNHESETCLNTILYHLLKRSFSLISGFLNGIDTIWIKDFTNYKL